MLGPFLYIDFFFFFKNYSICSSDGKESTCNVGDLGSFPESGRSPGEENGNSLQYSCLENPMAEEPGGLQSMGSQESNMT